MTATENRRSVMKMAWSFFREARRCAEARDFADCLRGAWAFAKRLTQAAGRFMDRAGKAGGAVQLRSLLRAPSGRHLSQAAWLPARLGH